MPSTIAYVGLAGADWPPRTALSPRRSARLGEVRSFRVVEAVGGGRVELAEDLVLRLRVLCHVAVDVVEVDAVVG
jgi:hypothetical protein